MARTYEIDVLYVTNILNLVVLMISSLKQPSTGRHIASLANNKSS